MLTIGAPPKRTVPALAAKYLFHIYPTGITIQNGFAAVFGNTGFFFCADVNGVQVVLFCVGHIFSIGAQCSIYFYSRIFC